MPDKTKIIGLLGGMSWESSALYYRGLNQGIHSRLGSHHNARSVLFSLDYEELLAFASEGRWDTVGDLLRDAALRVQGAGADFLMITAITGHAVASQVETGLGIPLLHIADPAGEAVRKAGLTRVGLLGTRFTMEMDFFTDRLRERHGLDVLVPDEDERARLHRIIVEELTLGATSENAKQAVLEIAHRLGQRGAEGIIIGCTELPLLLGRDEYPIPAFNALQLHIDAAVEIALSGSANGLARC